jgi:hypothetical protein
MRSFTPAIISIALMFALVSNARAELEFGRLLDDSFIDEVFAPISHTHFSDRGTPYVHPFTFEPPQIHQDVFFIAKYTKGAEGDADEFETEFHIDWALTERLGILFAVPLLGNRQQDGTHNVGIGDLEIAPRVMWVKDDTFILASNFLITVPTGNEERDLGAGEATLSPLLTTWHDLGDWNSLLLNFGPQFGAETGDTSMIYGFSIAHSWLGRSWFDDEAHDDHDHGAHDDDHVAHFAPGMSTIYLELIGETQLDGAEQTFVEIAPGFSYVLAPSAELRFSLLLPVSEIKRFDQQYFLSFTWIY